jgi:hypothetical protein
MDPLMTPFLMKLCTDLPLEVARRNDDAQPPVGFRYDKKPIANRIQHAFGRLGSRL